MLIGEDENEISQRQEVFIKTVNGNVIYSYPFYFKSNIKLKRKQESTAMLVRADYVQLYQ